VQLLGILFPKQLSLTCTKMTNARWGIVVDRKIRSGSAILKTGDEQNKWRKRAQQSMSLYHVQASRHCTVSKGILGGL
jgi:hypothetical protein